MAYIKLVPCRLEEELEMKWTIAIVLLSASMAAFGQTAKVIALTPEEAAHALSLDARAKALAAEQKTFELSLRSKYLAEPSLSVCKGCAVFYKEGWRSGTFEFSDVTCPIISGAILSIG